jgi:hypothetical protein
MRTVEYFMWGFQDLFRHCAQRRAEQVFGLLDARLNPRVFLVGLRIREGSGVSIAVEPGDCEYSPTFFEDLPEQVRQILSSPDRVYWGASSEWEWQDNDYRQLPIAISQAYPRGFPDQARD